MSTRIMALCWPLIMPAPTKSVLISLADQANDDGVCWPSIASIALRTCLSERTIYRCLAWLVDHGLMRSSARSGHSSIYTLLVERLAGMPHSHPGMPHSHPGMPHSHGTSATQSPRTVSEPSKNRQRTKNQNPTESDLPEQGSTDSCPTQVPTGRKSNLPKTIPDLPPWLPKDEWETWRRFRKELRRPLTSESERRQIAQLERWKADGHDPLEIISTSICNGWQGLFEPKRQQQRSSHQYDGTIL